MTCLDDNLVSAYLESRLTDAERQRVLDHLASCEVCLLVTYAATDTVSAAARAMPAQLGRYTCVELIREGDLASVYRGRDGASGADVALELIRTAHAGDAIVRAARSQAAVRHPHVAAIRDAGTVDGGAYIAMDHVDGVTLDRWLAQPGRPPQEVLDVFAQVAAGLAAAHAAGLVHGDIAPHHVLVDRRGRATVTDFGIATAIDGVRGATARYQAPEQLRRERIDARTDQFSLAVAIFEALYGQLPFGDGDREELLRVFAARAPIIVPGAAVAPHVTAALRRALAIDPSERFATIAELARRLRPRRSRRFVAAAGAIALVSVAAAVLAVGNTSTDRAVVREADAPPRTATDRASQRREIAAALDAHRYTIALDRGRALLRDDPADALALRDVVLAELGSELLTDVVQRGKSALAVYARPPPEIALAFVAAAVLLGRRDDAAIALEQLATLDPALAVRARADIAAYEGRLDDAIALLRDRTDAIDRSRLARLWLRRGDRAHMTVEDDPPVDDGWRAHAHLARAHLAAGRHVEAEAELAWCLDHRGQAALVELPSLSRIPEAALLLARSRAARGANREARAAYQALAELGLHAQQDPWTDEARRELQRLAR